MFSLARHRLPSAPTRVPQLLTAPSHTVLSDTPPSALGSGTIFRLPAASATPPEATARQSAAPYSQRAASSDGSLPARASSSVHVSPAVRPSSPAFAADSSTPSSRFALVTPAAA